MQTRASKKRFKKTIFLIFIGIFILVVLFAIALSIKLLLPIVSGLNQAKNGKIIEPISKLASIDDIKEKLDDKNIILDSIEEATGSALVIAKVKDGPKVYFSKTKDTTWQVNSLHLILSKFTIDNKKLALVDLRFERPIVKF